MSDALLTLNAGSSSLKFSLFTLEGDTPTRRFLGAFDRGAAPDRVTIRAVDGEERQLPMAETGALSSAFAAVLDW